MSAALEVANLSAGYGKLTILSGVSFSLPAGVTLGVLGPNGAGKSTLLKSLAGLLPCGAGTISLDGMPIARLKAFLRARQGISLVPEGRQIFGEMTVEENLFLAFNARGKRLVEGAEHGAVREVYDLFPALEERRRQIGSSLSGGQQQMLAIGRALIAAPRVLMLDEPTQGLAPVVVQELRAALRKLKPRFSIIVVEQNRDFLDGLADRILRMEDGHLQSFASEPTAGPVPNA